MFKSLIRKKTYRGWKKHKKNVLETKCIKSGGKSRLSLSFLSYTVNDVRRKLYMVGIQLAVGKRARRMPDTTVETTLQLVIVCAISSCFSLKVRCLLRIK